MNELPLGWSLRTIGDVCEKPQYGWTTKARKNGPSGLRLLRTTDITGGSIEWGSVPYCEVEPPEPGKFLLEDGDIVVSRAGSVGVSLRVRRPESSVFASYLIRLRTRSDIDADFLSWFLKSRSYWQQVEQLSAGIALQNINAKKLAAIALPVPPLEEQQGIVATIEEQFSRLDAADRALRECTTRTRQLTDGIVFRALDGARSRVCIRDVATVDAGPAFRSKYFKGPNEGTRLLRGENIEPGSLRWKDTRTWPDDMLAGYEHLLVRETDIILAMDRPIVAAGLKLARVRPTDLPALLVQRVARIRAGDRVRPGFLFLVLRDQSFVRALLAGQTGTQLPHITLKDIREHQMPLPTVDEQEAIIAEVEQQESVLTNARRLAHQTLTRSRALRDVILRDAFAGRLVRGAPDIGMMKVTA